MPFDSLIEKHLNNLKDEIIKTMQKKGMVSKGDAIDSLQVKDNALWGVDYIYYLDQGRGPGKFPPPENIVEWVRQKLRISDLTKSRQVAYLTGRKIAREGTRIFKDKRKGLQLETLINNMLDELYKEIPSYVIGEVQTILNKQ